MAERSVRVRLEAVTASYKKAMDDASQSTKTFIERAGGIEAVGQKVSNLGGTLTRGLTLPLAAAAGLAVKSASDLEQAVGGTEAVFGDARDAIDEYAKTAASASGLSEREFREATTSIGGQLKRMTGDVDLAADRSIELTQVAADLAATYGGTTKDAVNALGSAFRGEADPAERFNLNLKMGAVNAKAVEMGLAATEQAVDENARAQATYALIMEQSADAQGQFARESDTVAGSMQIAKAEMENASAEIGSALLPFVAKLAGGVADLAGAFGKLPDPVQNGVIALGGLLAAAGPLMSIGGRMMQNWQAIGRGFDRAAVGAYDLAGGMGKIARAGAVVGILYGVGKALDATVNRLERADLNGLQRSLLDLAETGEITGEAAGAFGDNLGGLADAIERVAAPSVLTQADHAINTISTFGGLLGRGKGDLDEAKAAIDDLDQALASLASTDPDAAASALDAVREALSPEDFERLLPLLDNYGSALDGVDVAARTGAEAVDEFGNTTGDASDPVATLEAALDALSESFDALLGVNLSAEQAVIKVNDAFSALPGVLAENGASLDLNTEAGRRNRDAITGLVGDIDGHVQALIDQGASSKEVAWTLHAYRNRLIETGTAAGMSKSEISNYINTLGLTPSNIDTWVALHGTGQAEAALAALTRARTATITVATRMAGWFGYDVGGRATGGYVNYLAEGGVPNFRPKGTDTVPAMLTPGEFVIRKSAVDDLGVGFLEKLNAYGSNAFGTMQAAPSGGGTTVHKTYQINVTGIGDRELARKVRDAVATADRRGV